MQKTNELSRRSWLTYFGCLILTVLCYGTAIVLSIYVKGLCEAFHATTTQIQLLYSIKAFCSVLVSFSVAGLLGKISSRKLLGIGVVFYSLFFLCLSLSHSLVVYYIGAACFGIGVVLMGSAVVQPVITQWHTEHLGIKLGALTVSYSVVGALFSLLFTRLQLNIGTQPTLLIHGLILMIPGILSVLFLISDRPEAYGLEPALASPAAATNSASTGESKAVSTRECFRRPETWLLLMGIFLDSILYGGFHSNASIVYGSLHFDAMQTASLISIQTVFVSIWGFGYGAVSDRFGSTNGLIAIAAAVFATMLIAMVCAGSTACPYILAAVLAAMVGSVCYQSMAGALVFAELFGKRSISVLMAVSMGFVYIGQMIGTPIATLLYEHTGSNITFFRIMAVVTALITLMYVFIRILRLKTTKHPIQEEAL